MSGMVRSDWYWSIGGLAVMTLGSVLSNVVVARALSRTEVGVYFVCVGLIVVLSLVGRLGLDYAVVRNTSAALAQE